MMNVVSLSHLTLQTPDIARQLEHACHVLGLSLVAREDRRAFLANPQGEVSLVLENADRAHGTTVTLELAPDADLDEAARRLLSADVKAVKAHDSGPFAREALRFIDPDGLNVELCVGRQMTTSGDAGGISPGKLGHIAFNVLDVQRTVDFYMKVLGFRLSDWMGDFFAFLRCTPDHHSLNFLIGQRNKMHHVAFELKDWGHVKRACDHLAYHRIPLIWGPVRHGVGHNISVYYKDPDDQIIELYTEMDIMNEELGYFEPRPWHDDRPQIPKIWTPCTRTSNMWGIPTPNAFRD